MKSKKIASTFRLSLAARAMLARIADRGGTTKTACLEEMIRREARRLRIANDS